MNNRYLKTKILVIGITVIAAAVILTALASPPTPHYEWSTVVNNGDFMPTDLCNPLAPVSPPCRMFNSYNQPSVNANRLVVFRARSKGGKDGEPVHGVYTRDMAVAGPTVKILDRNTVVPQPNNLASQFVEPPSFPRIDMRSNTVITRGNHQPVWQYSLPNGSDTRAGTSGIYTNPFGDLIAGASRLGSVPEFSFFEVPEVPGTPFDVFPGAPAVTNGAFIVFKGNYTEGDIGKTGVYYRHMTEEPTENQSAVVLIANNTQTLIPGTNHAFGSTAPPSAANNHAVFAGFDNEENPTAGGIYLAPLTPYRPGKQPKLKTLVSIGEQVPGEIENTHFNKLGEGVSFDGRFAAFWGAWGLETKLVRLYCPDEGNEARRNYCKSEESGSTYDAVVDNWYQETEVPLNQGIFVRDTKINKTFSIARTHTDGFSDFVYWNFSGRAPGIGEGEEGEEDGELARWRSASFMAVSGKGVAYKAVFKARTGTTDDNNVFVDPVDGIYFGKGSELPIQTILDTTMDGQILDPEAPEDSIISELGLEREGLRDDWLVVSAKMGIEGGAEEDGMAGIYMTRMPPSPKH